MASQSGRNWKRTETIGESRAAAESSKKVSGLQKLISERLFIPLAHVPRRALARIASSMVWLVCACQGCPEWRRALRARFSFCASTVTVLAEPGTWRLGFAPGFVAREMQILICVESSRTDRSLQKAHPCAAFPPASIMIIVEIRRRVEAHQVRRKPSFKRRLTKRF